VSFVAPSLAKSYFTAARYAKIHQKFIRRKVQDSLGRIDFFVSESDFLRNMRIFKKNTAMGTKKYIFPNLMSSAFFGYISILMRAEIRTLRQGFSRREQAEAKHKL